METLVKSKKNRKSFLEIKKNDLSEETMNFINQLVFTRVGVVETKSELLTVAVLCDTDGMDILEKCSLLYPIEWANNFIDQVHSDLNIDVILDNSKQEITKEDLSEKSISLIKDYVENVQIVYRKTNLHELLRYTIGNGASKKEVTPLEVDRIFGIVDVLNDLTDSLYEDATWNQ